MTGLAWQGLCGVAWEWGWVGWICKQGACISGSRCAATEHAAVDSRSRTLLAGGTAHAESACAGVGKSKEQQGFCCGGGRCVTLLPLRHFRHMVVTSFKH